MLTGFIATFIGVMVALKGVVMLFSGSDAFFAVAVIVIGIAVAVAGYGVMQQEESFSFRSTR